MVASSQNGLSEKEVAPFIEACKGFFEKNTRQTASFSVPYLVSTSDVKTGELTGVIHISGPMRGIVAITGQKEMWQHFLMVAGFDADEESLVVDAAGEAANTIAGNAREKFGADFNISTPRMNSERTLPDLEGIPDQHSSISLPVTWKGYNMQIVVTLWSE